jgi:hypothetical protein
LTETYIKSLGEDKMTGKLCIRIICILCFISLFSLPSAFGKAVNKTWLGGDGLWFNSIEGLWNPDPKVGPNNGGGTEYVVSIDMKGSNVSLNGDATINTLYLGRDCALLLGSSDLDLTTEMPEGLKNDGIIRAERGTLNLSGTITNNNILTAGTQGLLKLTGTVTNSASGIIRTEGGDTDMAGSILFSNCTVQGGHLDNTGTIEVAGGTVTVDSASQLNMLGTLSGGTWIVRRNSSIGIYEAGPMAARIKTNEATILLDGPGSKFQNVDTLENNQGKGRFTITNGRAFTTLGKLANSGAIEVGPQSTLTINEGYTQTDGITRVDEGTVVVNGGYTQTNGMTLVHKGTLTVNGKYTQTDGMTQLDEGTLTADAMVLNGGTLVGNGVIDADVYNEGEISPGFSPGLLRFLKNFTQKPKGKIIIEIGGTESGLFDEFEVNGLATLGGTLEVRLTDGFKPRLGNVFPIFSFGNRVSDFDTYIGLQIGDLFLKPVFDGSGFHFECVPEPVTLSLLILGGLALVRRRR